MYAPVGTPVTSTGRFGLGQFGWFPEGETMQHGATACRDRATA